LVKPLGSRRKTHNGEEDERAVGQAQPGHGGPGWVMTELVIWARALASAMESWLSVWTASSRRLAMKPSCRSAGRLVSYFPIPKSRVSLILVSVLMALPSL